MKKGVVIVSFLCLLLGFQNCSQSNLSGETNPDDISTKVAALEVVSKVELPSTQSSQWVLEVESGQLHYTAPDGSVSATRCLSAQDQQTLDGIFAGASICETEVSPDAVCSMQYSSGYAILVSDREDRVMLGEKLNGCGAGQKEICGIKGEAFKAFLTQISANINSMACQ